MVINSDERPMRGTTFYPRTSLLTDRPRWYGWDHYHIVDEYTEWQEEVARIRNHAAVLDQSPLSKHFIVGPDAVEFVDYLITRDATRIEVGQITYSPWCNEDGLLVGEGVVARVEEDRFLISSDPMMNWFRHNSDRFEVTIEDATHDFGLLAIQGPKSTAVLEAATGETLSDLKFSRLRTSTVGGVEVTLLRTGFTGEVGYELWVPAPHGPAVWDALFDVGAPLGLGVGGFHSTDVARIEAGLLIVGGDYTPTAMDRPGDPVPVSPDHVTTPLELNLHHFVDLDTDADFIGKAALKRELVVGPKRSLVGIEIDWRAIVTMYLDAGILPEVANRVIRSPLPISQDGANVGRATSVTWSPTINKLIGFAHVKPAIAQLGTPVEVDWCVGPIRGEVDGTLVQLPHYELRRAG